MFTTFLLRTKPAFPRADSVVTRGKRAHDQAGYVPYSVCSEPGSVRENVGGAAVEHNAAKTGSFPSLGLCGEGQPTPK
jgi:hypothetical protein